MPTGSNFDFPKLLAKKSILQVPTYQRDYNWKARTCDKLLEDLIDHALEESNQKETPYFLGNMIMQKEDEAWFLVDGQQRTTALTLIACAVRDLMVENEEFKLAHDLHETIIFNKEQNCFRFSPKSDSETHRNLGYYQSFCDLEYDITFTEVIEEDEPVYAKTNEFTPQRYIPENTKYQIEGIGEITVAKNLPCVKINRIPLEVDLHEDCKIDVGQTLKISSLDRTKYKQNINVNLSKRITVHYKRIHVNIKKRLKDYVAVEGHISSNFFKNLKAMLVNLSFTTTEFKTDEEAIYYFEIMNDDSNRLSLSSGDLLRAKIETINISEEYTQEHKEAIKNKFDTIETNLIAAGSYDYVSEFMWTWLLSRGKRVSKKKTWSYFKQLFEGSSGEDIVALMNTLANESQLFREITFPQTNDPEYGSLFSLFGVLKQHHPLMLNVYSSYKVYDNPNNTDYSSHLRRLTRIFSYFFLRGSILPELDERIPSNHLYNLVEAECKKIWSWDENVDDWRSHVRHGTPEKDKIVEFLNSFSSQVVDLVTGKPFKIEDGQPSEKFYEEDIGQANSKLILSNIEWYMRGYHEENNWTDGIEVEHILPQNPAKKTDNDVGEGFKDWSQFTTEEHKANKNLLGNRLLLPEGANKKLRNDSFTKKKELPSHGYSARAASWKLTKLVNNSDNWRVDEIRSYGIRYSKIAVHIFGHESFLQEEITIPTYENSRHLFETPLEMENLQLPPEEE